MKKLLSLLFAGMLFFGLTACGGGDDTEEAAVEEATEMAEEMMEAAEEMMEMEEEAPAPEIEEAEEATDVKAEAAVESSAGQSMGLE